MITFASTTDTITVIDSIGKTAVFPRSSVRVDSFYRGSEVVAELRSRNFNEIIARIEWDNVDQEPFHDSQEMVDFIVDLFMGTTIAEARYIMSEILLILTTEDGKFLTTEA